MQCQHPPCTCQVADGLEHCGPSCRTGVVGDDPDQCRCGHEACENSVGEG